MKKIDANETNLRGYLGLNTDVGILSIPFSQRPYEWTQAEVTRLFSDLTSLYFNEDQIHMLNFFTLSGEGNVTKIFDGQQRTITTILILNAFIKKLHGLGLVEAADQFYKDNIEKIDFAYDDENIQKIIFDDEELQEFFYMLLRSENINDIDSSELQKVAHKTMLNNYKHINSLLDDFIDKNNLSPDEVKKVISRILLDTNLITIKTDTDELAMAMFESLNNTGKQLENYYVLKNDLVMTLGEDLVKEKWQTMESNLMNYNASDFLTAFTTLHLGKTSKDDSLRNLYKNNLYDKNSAKSMLHMLDLLVNSSRKYLYLRNPAQLANDNLSTELRENFTKHISNLNLFITKQYHPLILAMMMKEFEYLEIVDIIKALLNLGIRNIFFKEQRANTIETFLANLSREVYIDNIEKEEIISRISEKALSNLDTKDAIITKSINTKPKEKGIKFILRETYNLIDLDKELAIRNDLKDIQYEHILPVKPKSDSQWVADFTVEEERKQYNKRIGNATLLLGKYNNSINNKNFEDKKLIYEESAIPENKEIAKLDQWTPKEIEHRGSVLADKIIMYLESLVK